VSIDVQRQFDTATAYFLAGERCALELKFGTYDFHSVAAPTITNYAFAVELALKLIHLLASGQSAFGHDLKRLYDDLPDDIHRNLPQLAECAADIARYFEYWRYPFEKDFFFGDFENPRRAFIECYGEIKRLQSQLTSVYESHWGSFEPEWILTWPIEQPRWELRLAEA
jgi:HEPN domain-containing protein